ncbi:MAG: hypothetical protein Q9170_004625 [Blastenia crenularia]
MIQRDTFEEDYRLFWSTESSERATTDASLVAMIFVMLAMGTQFVDLPSVEEKEQTAEFYISASHQALRMFSYLGRPSMRSIQTMVLITYFLMNDNHASDAWAFAGILQRQAYALGLNRDPSIVKPDAHPSEMQQRRKVWQAVFMQDTFLSVIIKLPPTDGENAVRTPNNEALTPKPFQATHTDVRIEDLTEDEGAPAEYGASDTSFIRSMLLIAELVKDQPPGSNMDQMYLSAKTDILKMVGILQLSSEHDLVARTRVGVLSSYL